MDNYFVLFVFVALRPMSTAMVIAGRMDNYCLDEHVNLELYKNNVSKLIFKTYAAPFPVRRLLGWGCNKK